MNDTLKELSISIACLLDEPNDISINDIEHLQDLVTKLENALKTPQEYYVKCDEIIEQGVCTEDELSIAVHFGGASMATLETLINYKAYLKTEYRLEMTGGNPFV